MKKSLIKPLKFKTVLFSTIKAYGGEGCPMLSSTISNESIDDCNSNTYGNGVCPISVDGANMCSHSAHGNGYCPKTTK